MTNITVRNIFNDLDIRRYNRAERRAARFAQRHNRRLYESAEDDKVNDLIDDAQDELDELAKMFDTEEDNSLLEDDSENTASEPAKNTNVSVQDNMTDEELKDESLKIAINVAKLMTNVQANDIITIAGTLADFIRNHEIGKGDFEALAPEDNEEDNQDNESEPEDLNMEDLLGDETQESSDAENENLFSDGEDFETADTDNPFENL